jgi:hypothetical protein
VDRALDGSESRSGLGGEEKNSFSLPSIEPLSSSSWPSDWRCRVYYTVLITVQLNRSNCRVVQVKILLSRKSGRIVSAIIISDRLYIVYVIHKFDWLIQVLTCKLSCTVLLL